MRIQEKHGNSFTRNLHDGGYIILFHGPGHNGNEGFSPNPTDGAAAMGFLDSAARTAVIVDF